MPSRAAVRATAASDTMAKARMKRQGALAQPAGGGAAPPQAGRGTMTKPAARPGGGTPGGLRPGGGPAPSSMFPGAMKPGEKPGAGAPTESPATNFGPPQGLTTRPGAEPAGGPVNFGPPAPDMPGGMNPQQLRQMLPPALQQPAWKQLQEAGVAGQGSPAANRAMLAARGGAVGGPPPQGVREMPFQGAGGPDASASAPAGQGSGAPLPTPSMRPGMEPAYGGQETQSLPFDGGVQQAAIRGAQGGFPPGMNPQQLRQMLPPAMQNFQGQIPQGGQQGFMPQPAMGGQAQGGGLNPNTGGAQGGNNPFRFM